MSYINRGCAHRGGTPPQQGTSAVAVCPVLLAEVGTGNQATYILLVPVAVGSTTFCTGGSWGGPGATACAITEVQVQGKEYVPFYCNTTTTTQNPNDYTCGNADVEQWTPPPTGSGQYTQQQVSAVNGCASAGTGSVAGCTQATGATSHKVCTSETLDTGPDGTTCTYAEVAVDAPPGPPTQIFCFSPH